ncbi:Bacterial Ig-like domain (group 2) [Maioricimonas rarisocia]|uniref:Bacterial Ig-like domain (Group 2) n=2 Tax=Maioricimonas rarisocia TaxID=2528026 RepID=A0A517ZEV9_9PLAN|nr:Bacterial Ig-like domain (group 2) [Maioricimonas rarisocia]
MNRCWGTLLLLCLTAGTARAESELVLLPEAVRLHGPEARTQLLLQHRANNEFTQQVTDGITWETSNPDVAKVTSDGQVRPVADGKTTIVAKVGEQTAEVPVEVSATQEPFTWGFRRHVQPLLAKLGCNSGACHGALAGKGGFRLSLRGYDPATDYFNIVKQDRGRRVELSDPGRSLVLAKPSGAIPHKGGLRFEPDSLEYRILAEWIASGAAPPTEDDARVERIEVLPGRSLHQVGEKQQMLVLAHYSDGTQTDVTRWAKWSSTNEAVCMVEEDGSVTVIGPGEGAVVGWYASQIAIARITVPFTSPDGADAKPQVVDQREPRNFIDEHVDRQLARLNLPASPACSDSEFIRRAYVDTIGLLPTAEEVKAFLADTSEDKRDRLIEDLLGREEFVDYWTYKWSDVLMLNGTLLRPEALKSYYEWIRGHVEKNTPWDQTVREVLTATGNSFENGATNFYALHQTPEDMTENACQAFLGLSIGCAKCHNHPLEKWTNDQYYGMANLFARVKAKGWGGESRNGDGLRTLYVVGSGELVQPRTGKPQPPTPLDGDPLPFDDPTDRRVPLAEWLTAPENPYFARSITNRVWANFYGVGLVENVDDMRASNPASNDELLTAAADFLIEKKFDLKELMRVILQSNAYQRTSEPLPGNQAEQRFYSRYYPRRMMAEVLHDAVVSVTDVPTTFDHVAFPGADRQKTEFYPVGTRAIELYDSAVENYFLQTFGRNQRRIVCECERSDEPSMVQVLHLSNGNTINEKLKTAGSRADDLLRLRAAGMSDATLLDEIYLTCLARYPTPKEREELLAMLPEPGTGEERAVLEDIFWAVMTSREFLFNH